MPPPDRQQGISVDLRDYKERVAKGTLTLQRLGKKSFQMIMSQYDSMRGDELDPVVVPIDPDSIDGSIKIQEKVIEDANKALESLKLLRSEMDEMIANKSTVAQPNKTAIAEAVGGAIAPLDETKK